MNPYFNIKHAAPNKGDSEVCIHAQWFTNRVVNDWNRLSSYVVSAELIGSFKRRLDECMDRDDRWDG